jgi:N-acetylmuramoyl-L-alanine amidase-like protein
MASPMTAAQWRAVLAAEGVHAAFHAGWETFGRDDETGKPFGPVFGVVIHHTAGQNDLHVILNGLPNLPPPLAHAWCGKTEGIVQTSCHRANHAGTVPVNVRDAMVSESGHPTPDVDEPLDGNDFTYGLEIENRGDGRDPYPAYQYDQAVRWATAICRFHKWSAASCFGHKEITRRKTDPSFSMDRFRADVAERLAHPASWTKGDTTVPTQPAVPAAYSAVLETDAIPSPVNHPSHDANLYWTGEQYIRFLAEELIKTRDAVLRIEAQLRASQP